MADTYSNYLKVVFVAEDLLEMSDAILHSNCFTVQHFHYESRRNHNIRTGITLHSEESPVLDCTIRINAPDCGRQLLEHIQDPMQNTYTFLFNATFKPTGRLEDYEDAMVASGCIVDIMEEFTSGKEEQMLMHIKLLLNSITFIGKESNLLMVV